MKKLSLLSLLLITSISSSWGATCTNAEGWKISTKEHHQPSRVAGNTLVFVHDPAGNVALSFSATSLYAGEIPPMGSTDLYSVETIWVDGLQVESMSWSRWEVYCPRCWPEIATQNKVTIQTAKQTISCKGGE